MSDSGDTLIGQVIRGYELREMIGIGGFGSVYRAYQAVVDREVAIKIILPEHANNPDFVRRFEREAQFIARLEHLHIIPIYDYWRDPGSAYIVMRYLKGGNLLNSLEQGGPWTLGAAAVLIDQIAAALNAAHRTGIVHQDLKPENILLDSDQNAYLSDFGIAKDIITGYADAGERYGSPGYASPEQVLGHPVTPMSDIYSFSLVIYALLTGGSPYKDDNTFTLLRKTVYEPLPSILDKRPDLPPEIDVVLQCASAKDPAARYHEALSLAAEFRRAANLPSPTDTATWAAVAPVSGTFTTPTARRQETYVLEPLLAEQVRNPFKGLRAFEETDSRDFFGRDALIKTLAQRLTDQGPFARFLAVVGPSGSGKSSVVSAGLLPALRRGEVPGSERWFITQMTPGAQPLQELEQALLRVAFEDPAESLVEQMLRDDNGLHASLAALFPLAQMEVFLFIDQFEELFVPTVTDEERTQFLDNLVAALTDPSSRLRVIVTLRADFIDRPLLIPGFGDLLRQRTEFVLPLSGDELEQAILQPARSAGLTLDENLLADIVADLREQPGALPLLQFALTELYERRDQKTLTQRAYREIGGVAGALVRRADELYASLDAQAQRITRQLFLRLVILGDGAEDTRRRLMRQEILSIGDKGQVSAILDLFGKYRLLTFDNDPKTRAPTVEIAHEALIRQWRRLREWLTSSRDDLRVQQRLGLSAAEWLRSGRDTSFLASGVRLIQFEQLLTSENIALSANERDYLATSVQMHQRRQRLRQIMIVGLTVITLIAVASALLAFDGQSRALLERDRADIERDRASQQARISDSRRLANNALTERLRLDQRLLLSLQALTSYDTTEARASLLTGLTANPRVQAFLTGHDGALRSVAVSPDGATIATAGDDGLVILWSAASRQRLRSLTLEARGSINALVFSPTGDRLAIADDRGAVIIWKVDSSVTPLTLDGHTGRVWAVDFSPDGRWLASGGRDGALLLWDMTEVSPVGLRLNPTPADQRASALRALRFSPDGMLLASGGEDQQITLWDMATREPLAVLNGHQNWVTTLDFNASGQYIASSGPENRVYLWDVPTRSLATSFPTEHRFEVNALAFSPRGLALVTASQDNTLKFWDLSSGQLNPVVLNAHVDAVWDVAFTPDGLGLISASWDGSAILWSLSARQPLARALPGHSAPVWPVAFNRDGSIIATGSSQNNQGEGAEVRLWQVTPGGTAYLTSLDTGGHAVYALDFAERLLAVGLSDGTVLLWDVDTDGSSREVVRWQQGASLTSVAFSPDLRQLATADTTGRARLWRQDREAWVEAGEALPTRMVGMRRLAYHPTGDYLVGGYEDGSVVVLSLQAEANDASRERLLSAHTDSIEALAFSPDGRWLATGGRDNVIRLWDTTTWEAVSTPLAYHVNWVTDLDFSPDGRWLVSASRDRDLMLWDMRTRQALGVPLRAHTDWVNTARFSPDGKTLVSAGWDSTVLLWDVALEAWQARACAVANRNLTEAEWQAGLPTPFIELCPELDQG